MSEELKPLLHRIGKLIRRHGVKEYKKHGNYWRLELINGIYLYHDDYNHSVFLNNNKDETLVYYGIDFGGFKTNVSREGFERMIALLNALDAIDRLSKEGA
jgi:hypothetical protein